MHVENTRYLDKKQCILGYEYINLILVYEYMNRGLNG